MKANELRIGNWVLSQDRDDPYFYQLARVETTEYTDWNSGDEYSVVGKIEGSVDGYYDIKPSPIPLTEDWLVKFGFDSVKPRSGIAASYKKEGLRINISNSGNFYFNSKPVRYVHILQNLFYFHELTGQELTIKEQ